MERYEVQVLGHLTQRRAASLGCTAVLNLENGLAVLRFPPLDQAALHGLLSRLRDAGIELVGLSRLAPDADGAAAPLEGAASPARPAERHERNA